MTPRPLLPYGRQSIDEEDLAALAEAAGSDLITQGPRVAEFERALAEAVGAPYAVAVSSGTAALHLACAAAGLGPGDISITSPITFVASANAAVYCGAEPRFADIDAATHNLSPARLKDAIAATPPLMRPRAIVPVHYAGLPVEIEAISRLAKASGALVIEDACHALGARYRDASGAWHTVGSCAHSDMACFSFHPVKHITTGEGGAITTRSEALYKRLLLLRTHGITRDPQQMSDPSQVEGPWYYEMVALGWNYRITDLQCALGCSQLRRLPRWVARRREIAARYREGFAGVEGIVTPVEPEGFESSYHLFPLWFDEALVGRTRREIFESLREAGLGVQVHYIPVHLQPFYRQRFGTRPGQFPEAERFYRGEISIPMYPQLTDDDVARVIDTVTAAVRRPTRP